MRAALAIPLPHARTLARARSGAAFADPRPGAPSALRCRPSEYAGVPLAELQDEELQRLQQAGEGAVETEVARHRQALAAATRCACAVRPAVTAAWRSRRAVA